MQHRPESSSSSSTMSTSTLLETTTTEECTTSAAVSSTYGLVFPTERDDFYDILQDFQTAMVTDITRAVVVVPSSLDSASSFSSSLDSASSLDTGPSSASSLSVLAMVTPPIEASSRGESSETLLPPTTTLNNSIGPEDDPGSRHSRTTINTREGALKRALNQLKEELHVTSRE